MDALNSETSEPSRFPDAPEMTAAVVVMLLEFFRQAKIDLYIDGGWGVDALLGRQTRPHSDLDIALQHTDVPRLRALLEARGFRELPRDDSWECNFVFGDDQGRQVDVHSYTFDSTGNHIFGVAYPFDSLSGTGFINGIPVKCISPEWMVKFHSGYRLDWNDYQDVKALCQHFGIPLPDENHEFESGSSPFAASSITT
jgi:lincosamide nucleotidyltransferase A/C/D/E